MDFKKLIPDFSAFGRTNWGKPSINTGDMNWLISAILVALMLVFVFIPWCSVSASEAGASVSGSRLGISTWYGIIGFIAALLAVYGALYEQKQFVFCGSVLGVLFGLLGIIIIPDVELTMSFMGMSKTETVTAENIKKATEAYSGISVGHIGAILFMVASAISAVWSFLQIKKEN